MLLAEARRAAEQVVQEALRLFEEPTLSSCAGSAGAPPLAWLRVSSPLPLRTDPRVGVELRVTLTQAPSTSVC